MWSTCYDIVLHLEKEDVMQDVFIFLCCAIYLFVSFQVCVSCCHYFLYECEHCNPR